MSAELASKSRAPRLRTVLLLVNVVILVLPLGGIGVLRLYETALLRQTESELIAQAAFVRAAYAGALRGELERRSLDPARFGLPLNPELVPEPGALQPIPPALDRAADTILPPAPDPIPAARNPHEAAQAAGDAITPMMREAQRTTLAGVRVVDTDGVVVATTRGEGGLSLHGREEVVRALAGEHVRVMRERISDEPRPALESISRGTRVRVFVALPVVVGDRVWGAVILSRTPLDVAKALFGIRGYLIGAAVVLLLVVSLVSLFTSLTIVRPVQALIRQSERVSRGERGAAHRLESPVTWEFAQLSEAIARMAGTLEDRAAYIDTFASNVSHEFKTPLTAIRGTIELLRDHLDDMTEEERTRFLSNLEADANRLDKLVRRLLDLARADVLKPSLDDAASVKSAIESAAGLTGSQGARIEVEIEPEIGRVPMASETLESILINLIQNARQHGGDGVLVTVSARREGASVTIEVKDDGAGISEANQKRVFDRFFTTARAEGGSGLGLSIVKALAEAHQGRVSLRSRPGETVVALVLPSN